MKLRDHVVKITANWRDGSTQHGFGFVVGERDDDLYIVTADHVVRGTLPDERAETIALTFFSLQGQEFPARLLGTHDADRDVAVLLAERPSGLQLQLEILRRSRMAMPERGTQVWYVGRSGRWYVPSTPGTVNSVDLDEQIWVDGLNVQVGTSGAPLVADDGIVGMVVADDSGGVSKAIGIGFIERAFGHWAHPWQLREADIRAPAPITTVLEGARTPAEEALVTSQLQRIQRFLCAENVDGTFGPETRDLIRIWQEAYRHDVTGSIDSVRQGEQLLGDALSEGTCNLSVYRNAYERLELTDVQRVRALRDDLSKLDARRDLDLSLPTTVTSVDQLRDALEVAGRSLTVDTDRGFTPAFASKLADSIRSDEPAAPGPAITAPQDDGDEQAATARPDFNPFELRRAIESDLSHYATTAPAAQSSSPQPGELAPTLSITDLEVRFAGRNELQVVGYVMLEDLQIGLVKALVTPLTGELLAVTFELDRSPSPPECEGDMDQETLDLLWDRRLAAFTGLRAAFSSIELFCPNLSLQVSGLQIDSSLVKAEGALWNGHIVVGLEGLWVAENRGGNHLRTDAFELRIDFEGVDLDERARLLQTRPSHYWPRRTAVLGAALDFFLLPADLVNAYVSSVSNVNLTASLRGLKTIFEDGSQSIDVALADGGIEVRSTDSPGLSYRHEGLAVQGAEVGFPTELVLDLRLDQPRAGPMLGELTSLLFEQDFSGLLHQFGPVVWQVEGAGQQSSAQGSGRVWVEPGAIAPTAAATWLSRDPTTFLLETVFAGLARTGNPSALRRAVEETVLQLADVTKSATGDPTYQFELDLDLGNEAMMINGIHVDDVGRFFNDACTRYGC